ncbi:MAG: alpha-L-fucosidase [Acidimicrobiales bacterium]|nr:alpha-L-fucosidase [Acidimicrobiales bacterium]
MDDLADRPLPAWFDDAKLGIFVHWTAAAVPAFAPVGPSPFDLAESRGWEEAFARSPYVEWYQNSLAIEGSPVWEHHRAVYGDLPYEAFVRTFQAGHAGWRPDLWADLFARAGARYVVLVTKHHDGFCLWPTRTPNPRRADWCARRDLVGELAAEVRARGMRFGTYYSGGLDWTFGGPPIDSFPAMIRAIPQSDEYRAYADAHWRELVERYEPALLWNDIGYPASADLPALFRDYLARVPDGVINNRFDFVRQSSGDLHADFVTPEYSTEAPPAGRKWEACRGIGTSFGFNRQEGDADHLPAAELVRLFADVVGRGGNLLLNVGPTGAGAVPWLQAQRLLALGQWLHVNGQAAYGTRPWATPAGRTADGLDVRYTVGDGGLHAMVLGVPTAAEVVLEGLGVAAHAEVRLLGRSDTLPWEQLDRGLLVRLPEVPDEQPAWALRITPVPVS